MYLTQSKGTSDDSDEVPLSKSLASKSKGKARPAQHRKIIQPRADSDTHDDDLPLTDAMPSKGKRSIGAPGTSKATGTIAAARPSRVNKRRRLPSPEGDKDTVSRQRCQQAATNLSCSSPRNR